MIPVLSASVEGEVMDLATIGAVMNFTTSLPIKEKAANVLLTALEDFETMPDSDPRKAALQTVALVVALGGMVSLSNR